MAKPGLGRSVGIDDDQLRGRKRWFRPSLGIEGCDGLHLAEDFLAVPAARKNELPGGTLGDRRNGARDFDLLVFSRAKLESPFLSGHVLVGLGFGRLEPGLQRVLAGDCMVLQPQLPGHFNRIA